MFYNVLKSIINIVMRNSKRNKKQRRNKKLKHRAYKLNDYFLALTGEDLLKDNFNNDTKKFNNWFNSKDTNIEHSRINRQVSNRLKNHAYKELENCEKLGIKIHEFEKYKKGYDETLDAKIDTFRSTIKTVHLEQYNNPRYKTCSSVNSFNKYYK